MHREDATSDARAVVIETPRVILRELTPADADALMEFFGDPVAMRYWPRTKTRDEVLTMIEWCLKCYAERGYGLWAAVLKETGEVVGRIGLICQRDINGRDEVEVAYGLIPRFWGKGLATEAAAACRDHAFSRLGCDRVISLVYKENTPSRRVAERLGMTIQGETIRADLPHWVFAVAR